MGNLSIKGYELNIVHVAKLDCTPDWTWHSSERRREKCVMAWYVLTGGCQIQTETELYHLRVGDYFVFDLEREYTCIHNPAHPLSVYEVCLQVEHSDREVRYVGKVRVENSVLNLQLWEKLLQATAKQEEEEQHIWLSAILVQLLNAHRYLPSDHQVVEKLCLEITGDPRRNFTLDELCTMSGYSANHLIRLFKRYKGVSPHEYITGVKMDKAKDLIANNMSVTKVAQYLNYYDANHFSKQFKKKTGLTPKAYAAQCYHSLQEK